MKQRVNNPLGFLSGSTLKIIACILMAVDHVGYFLFPRLIILRIIGRVSMPIFAFFIAEGCYYTKNKLNHFLLIFGLGAICQTVMFLAGEKLLNILLLFSVSELYIYLTQLLKKMIFKYKPKILLILTSIVIFLILLIPGKLLFDNFNFDYGFETMLLPVIISLFDLRKYTDKKWVVYFDNLWMRIALMAIGLFPVCYTYRHVKIQWFSYLALLPILFYNGKVGNKKLKYFFYLFYPIHIVIILAIFVIINFL